MTELKDPCDYCPFVENCKIACDKWIKYIYKAVQDNKYIQETLEQ